MCFNFAIYLEDRGEIWVIAINVCVLRLIIERVHVLCAQAVRITYIDEVRVWGAGIDYVVLLFIVLNNKNVTRYMLTRNQIFTQFLTDI